MTPKETYDKVFIEAFDLDSSQLDDGLAYGTVDAWDSVGQMNLIADIEDAFGIMMSPDDFIDFNSYSGGMDLLAQKYGVVF